MGHESGGSKTDTLVKLVLVFFITLLSFSVGTFVGKQFSDSQHKMAQLEDEGAEGREPATDPKYSAEEALTDEDIANLTEEFVNREKEKSADHNGTEQKGADKKGAEQKASDHKSADHKASDKVKEKAKVSAKEHGSESAHDQVQRDVASEYKSYGNKKTKSDEEHVADDLDVDPPKVKPSSLKEAVSKTAQRIAEGKAPTAPSEPERKPNSSYPNLAAGTVGKFTVQVASYASEGEAKKYASQLKEKGIEAFYIPAEVKGKTWYRVNIGLFESYKNAQSYREELLKETKVGSAIVQKIIR